MPLARSLAVASLVMLPLAAQAENLYALDAGSLARFFENEGAEVERTTDNVGDPKLRVDYYGSEFSVYYYGCDNNRNCDAVQFFSGYQTDGSVRLSKVNEWNMQNRFARSYISEEGSARIEMDIFMGQDGISADDFARQVSIWSRAMKDFEEFIGW
ncbi:YbjN domain-containing protein [Phaeobacter sp. QD34_3]|uniref:YbjN domain-containing protein n=1 Tax=unclassified Phaeobacter TaxID=2621772 RepID=UPI00237F4E63|nr:MULTISPECIES: YbjN domain-containing protein [unclassified Phaeobacter]MDE4132947.1 YbjN domain-containing protein [Phaeobacter sp. QD34_3]MDE4136651.1 YbjN domain-containing protein [Phaeobacter sp. QD34_24]MDE4174163.1 YbjN domain-containing protein [Phaeobacter sp. PT47_59]